LYSSINFSLKNTTLIQAANDIISNINYTHRLAMKDNKMQYYPINSGATEMNRSKYWFKQWWQIRFTQNRNDPKDIWYEIFTDLPYKTSNQNFDGKGSKPSVSYNLTYAINPFNKKYFVGRCDDNSNNYPNCNQIDKRLNLTQSYSIVKVLFNNSKVSSTRSKRLLFDSYGNVYLREGDYGDAGDINPYDKDERIPLVENLTITLCQDDNCEKNITICLTPKFGIASLCK
jgi:hypothetical protein